MPGRGWGVEAFRALRTLITNCPAQIRGLRGSARHIVARAPICRDRLPHSLAHFSAAENECDIE